MQAAAHALAHPFQLCSQRLCGNQIPAKGALLADRLGPAFRLKGAIVDPPGVTGHRRTLLAKLRAQRFFRHERQLADGDDLLLGEPGCRHRPDAPQHPHGQRGQKGRFLARPYDRQPARFVLIGGHFGHQLVGRHAQGRRQAGLASDTVLEFARDFDALLPCPTLRRQVQVGLVNAHLFDEGCGLAQDGHHLTRVIPIQAVPGREHDRLRTQLHGP